MEKEILNEILENHQHFLNRDVDGWETLRANLSGADLIDADLRNANLFDADLSNAHLMYADLHNADLRNANLRNADFKHASLRSANLAHATLFHASLCNTTLVCTNLYGANLQGADLQGADFELANLSDAIFDKEEEYRKGEILSESIIGWKKCIDNVVVELEIPKGAVVFSVNGRKCRTNKVKVISLSEGDIAYSWYDYTFKYEVGAEIEIKDFNLMYNVECGNGIHFFKSQKDAERF